MWSARHLELQIWRGVLTIEYYRPAEEALVVSDRLDKERDGRRGREGAPSRRPP